MHLNELNLTPINISLGSLIVMWKSTTNINDFSLCFEPVIPYGRIQYFQIAASNT